MEFSFFLMIRKQCLIKILKLSKNFLHNLNENIVSESINRLNQLLYQLRFYDKKIINKPEFNKIHFNDKLKNIWTDSQLIIQSIIETNKRCINKINDSKKNLINKKEEIKKEEKIFQKFKNLWTLNAGEKIDRIL